jgi:hypothetical protein
MIPTACHRKILIQLEHEILQRSLHVVERITRNLLQKSLPALWETDLTSALTEEHLLPGNCTTKRAARKLLKVVDGRWNEVRERGLVY